MALHVLPDLAVLRAENERLQLLVESLLDQRDEAQMNEAAALTDRKAAYQRGRREERGDVLHFLRVGAQGAQAVAPVIRDAMAHALTTAANFIEAGRHGSSEEMDE